MNNLLQRGEKISLLVKKTEDLSEKTLDMEHIAHKIKKQMWWQNKKLMLGIVALLLILLVVIIVVLVK